MIVREAKFKDYNLIKNLAKKYNLNLFKKKDWENIWKKNPLIKKKKIITPIGFVLEDKKKIVGHIGNIPTQYYLNSKNYIGSILNCWVVEPEYRLNSLNLVKKYIEVNKKTDFFLASSSRLITAKILSVLGWKKIPNNDYPKKMLIILSIKKLVNGIFKKYNLHTNKVIIKILTFFFNLFFYKRSNYWKKFKTKNQYYYYNKFNSEFDIFWNKIRQKNKHLFLLNRNKNWLNWHFNEKIKNKNIVIVVHKENKTITGYAICVIKFSSKTNIKKAILVDMMSFYKNSKNNLNLITEVIFHCKKIGCDLFEVVGFNKKKRRIIEKLRPFFYVSKFNPFYYNTANSVLNSSLRKNSSWDPSEIDGDSIF